MSYSYWTGNHRFLALALNKHSIKFKEPPEKLKPSRLFSQQQLLQLTTIEIDSITESTLLYLDTLQFSGLHIVSTLWTFQQVGFAQLL